MIVINGLQHVAPGIQVQAKHVQMEASNNAAVEQVAAGPPVASPTAVARALSAKASTTVAR